MIELTGEELREGNKQLGGIRIWYWIASIFTLISIIINAIYIPYIPYIYLTYRRLGINLEQIISQRTFILFIIVNIVVVFIFLIILIIGLVGLKNRRPYSIPLGRAILVLTMLNVPIGTIIGAILWGRLRHPAAKKYLNYGV